jgi:serine/threonine protein phosphatase PrpC
MKIAEALEIFSQTDPGMVRSHNEDSVACEPACGLAVLADGMGGYNAGTTIVSALFYDNRVAVGHVGDSRMYRLRGEVLETITHDHSLLQEQLDSGMISLEDARLSKNKNLVTRAVGIDAHVDSEIHVHEVLVGDIYLLCSDGLNDMVEDDDIQATLFALQSNLPLAASQLIQMANDNGGRDNISVILVKVKGKFSVPRGWLAKLLNWFEK